MGLIGAIEIVADKATKRLFDPKTGMGPKIVGLAQDEGLIVRAIGDGIAVCPPMVITEAEIDALFDRLGRALDRAEDWATGAGARAAA
ncbi:MAG: aspartate aminotransferase family protein, partial [Hansschlegelia sp.]